MSRSHLTPPHPQVFPYLETNAGLHGSFWVLALILCLILPVIYCFVPEAKDVHLNQVGWFFEPVTTRFYMDLPGAADHTDGGGGKVAETSFGHRGGGGGGGEIGENGPENKARVQMIENCFGTAGQQLNTGTRSGFLKRFVCILA